jgi:hypothetical protein
MSGKPKEARLLIALNKRAVLELGSDATALDYVVSYIAGGKMFTDLAADLAIELKEPVSRQLVSGAANGLSDDARERIAAARQEGAISLAEETLSIADNADATAGGAAKARVQISSRQWMAERFNAAQFGAMTKTQVSVSLGALMLEALQQPPPPNPFLQATPTLLLAATGDCADGE